MHELSEMPDDKDELEIRLLNEAILEKYGYDFRDYAKASFSRRVRKAAIKFGCRGVAGLLHRVLIDADFFSLLLNELTVVVTELFRDPLVYRSLREEVIPYLRAYPEIKVWCAGCAGGEEVFSIAILMQEEGLYDRTIFYGTDINSRSLQRAASGIVCTDSMKDAERNYLQAGGKTTLSNFYTARYGGFLINSAIRRQLVFSDHNLVTDSAFGEMQLILCRNVLIYFNKSLQAEVIKIFQSALSPRGFLCLGTKETMAFSGVEDQFDGFKKEHRIYRRKAEQ